MPWHTHKMVIVSWAIDSVTSLHLMYAGLFPSSFLPARRYASARTIARALCLSVCLCLLVCHRSVFYRNCWTDREGFWHVDFFRPVVRCVTKEIQISTKRAPPPATLSKTPDLEEFASAYRSLKRVIALARERWTLTAR